MTREQKATRLLGVIIAVMIVVGVLVGHVLTSASADNQAQVSQTANNIDNVSQAQTGVVYQVQTNSVKSNGKTITFGAYINNKLQTITLDKHEVNIKVTDNSSSYQIATGSNNTTTYTLSVPAQVAGGLN